MKKLFLLVCLLFLAGCNFTGTADIGKKYGLMSVIDEQGNVLICKKPKDINYKMGDKVSVEITTMNGICTIDKVKVLDPKGNDKQQIKVAKTDDKSISVAEFLQHQKNGTALIVDIRERAEFAAGHIPNAINVPLSELALRKDEIIDKANNRLIIFQCNTSTRAELAAYMFQRQGYNAKLIRGEIVFTNNTWEAKEKEKKS